MTEDIACKKLRVLVAEDSATVRKMIKSTLKKSLRDASIDEAVNGRETQTKLEEGVYDVVLCGWEIPEVTCDTVLKWARSHPDPAVHKISFIIISSKADKASVVKAVKFGANSYIMKPFTPASLIQKVSSVLGRSDMQIPS